MTNQDTNQEPAIQSDTVEDFEQFHPRAVKLLRKRKNFLVVAEDEYYYMLVYALIREHERARFRWTEQDELNYQLARRNPAYRIYDE